MKKPNNMKYSFNKGMGEVKNKDLAKIKGEIMDALFIFNKTSWGKRLKGIIEPRVSEKETIERIFKSYGIKNIWGV